MLSYPELLAVATGATEFIKTKLNLVDTAAEVLSAVVCVGSGSAWQYAQTPATTFEQWFTVASTGIVTWLTTAGLYKLVLSPAKKAVQTYVNKENTTELKSSLFNDLINTVKNSKSNNQ